MSDIKINEVYGGTLDPRPDKKGTIPLYEGSNKKEDNAFNDGYEETIPILNDPQIDAYRKLGQNNTQRILNDIEKNVEGRHR